jgi:hypothetical protein
MTALLSLLQIAVGIGSLVCFIMVIVKMFQNNATTIGIVSLVLLLVCGIGALVAFIYGWMRAAEWNITNVMLAWTGCIVAGFVLSGLTFAMGGPNLN